MGPTANAEASRPLGGGLLSGHSPRCLDINPPRKEKKMEEIDDEYNVQFIGDYFSMNVFVQGVESHEDDDIIGLASEIINYHYGFDVMKVSSEIYVKGR
jgi:hypothetical protein